jgi:hypothetical protein
MFVHETVGPDWLREMHFGDRRVERIARLLGDDVVKAVWQKVEDEFAKGQDPDLWVKFRGHRVD